MARKQDEPSAAEDGAEEPVSEDERQSRFGRFARKLMDRKELAEDTREMLVTLMATSDRAKSEVVRMAAREVRTYLEALELRELLTGYSLEVKASFHLKPLADALEGAAAEPQASVKVSSKSDAKADAKIDPKAEPKGSE